MHITATCGHLERAKVLVEAGADIQIETTQNRRTRQEVGDLPPYWRLYQKASRPPSTKVKGSASPRTVLPAGTNLPSLMANSHAP